MESSSTFIKFKTEQSILFIKSLNKIMSSCIIRTIYHSKFQSLLRYIVIFFGGGGGRGADNESIPTFKLKKRVIWLVCGVGTGISCKQLFRIIRFTVTSLYVFEEIRFTKN
jgi:hypothetical protein